MTIRLATLILLLHAFLGASGQQLAQYSSWMLNPYMYNPSAAGLENTLILTGAYRKQWVDLDGAPVSQHFNVSMPLRFLKSGVGLRLDNDGLGAHQTTQAMLNYSYHLNFPALGTLSLGVGAGYQQYSLDGARLRSPDGDYTDPLFQHNDAYLPLGRVNAGSPVFEMGLTLLTDRVRVGLSAIPVFSPVITQTGSGAFRLSPQQHFAFQSQYQIEWSDQLLLKPGLLLKSDLVATQVELGSLAVWKEKFTGGVAWRGVTNSSRDALVITAGLKINEKTTIAYIYDLPFSGLQSTNRGSHELFIQYNSGRTFGAGKRPPVIYNPRFR